VERKEEISEGGESVRDGKKCNQTKRTGGQLIKK
jgi:hypothetical protein